MVLPFARGREVPYLLGAFFQETNVRFKVFIDVCSATFVSAHAVHGRAYGEVNDSYLHK